jgi:hypothetical protein
MKRREFVASSVVAAAAGASYVQAEESKQQYLELRKYVTLYGSKKGLLDQYLSQAAIPAWNRLGIKPVGAFSVRYGQSDPTVFVLLPHPSMESVVNSSRQLLADTKFREDGKEFLEVSSSDASFFRIESSLMKAFTHMPTVEVPEAVQGQRGRIFELRIYESHSEIKAKKKIEMFNEGGEIAIFRNTGLYPVFFGETIIGTKIPNLTYMLAFKDMEERDKNWRTFISSPEWKELSANTEYSDTVCNISDLILSPKGYSQI